MNKSQLNGINDMQENSQQENPGVWSSWRRLPRVSLSSRWDWQRARGGAQAGDQILVGLGSGNSKNQEQAQSRGAPSGS